MTPPNALVAAGGVAVGRQREDAREGFQRGGLGAAARGTSFQQHISRPQSSGRLVHTRRLGQHQVWGAEIREEKVGWWGGRRPHHANRRWRLPMEVIIQRNYLQMSKSAAQVVVEVLNTKPNAVLGMATGSTPLGLYQELVRLHKQEQLDFARVTTFNLDEYVGLTANHPQSYHYFMHEHFFQHVNIPRQNINIPSGTTSNYPAFCNWYEERITECGGIDLQILGIGSDGHIAFNEPTSSLSSRTQLKTLSKQTIDDNARFFDAREDVPVYAITMGVGTILDARKLLLVASGKTKAKAVAQAVEGQVTIRVTASDHQLHRDAIVIVDEEAAAGLAMREYYEFIYAAKPAAPRT